MALLARRSLAGRARLVLGGSLDTDAGWTPFDRCRSIKMMNVIECLLVCPTDRRWRRLFTEP